MSDEKLFLAKHELVFKQAFAANFLSAWVAQHYDEYCSAEKHETLERPPVEDADTLARHAWAHWVSAVGLGEPSDD